ncbi:MAG: AAA family ATPase [Deltaproteobacteria bacterium]|nr:AAA family ATPase [Deltaproteobacteria bacterium]
MKNRVMKTGIPGLDTIMQGGFISGYSYLLAGSTGSGKTILSLQWLLSDEKLLNDGKCQFITLAERADELHANVDGFGWSLDKIDIVDLSPPGTPGDVEEYQVFSPSEVELSTTWKAIYDAIEKRKPEKLVIDSVTLLSYLSTDDYQFRKHLLVFVNYLKSIKCTTLLVYDPTEMDKDAALALSVDGVIYLDRTLSQSRVIDLRTIEIQKLRGSDYLSGKHHLRITHAGITVYPHIIQKEPVESLSNEALTSGIAELDELLKGGLDAGTTTLITGPAGVGKSTLGMQYLLSEARKGNSSVLYSFEEHEPFIVKRAENLGMDIRPYIENGTIKIVFVNPLELYPDELLQMIRGEVKRGVKTVVFDSMRGYNLSIEQFGNVLSHMQNLINFLKTKKVSVFIINELELITGDIRLTDYGISYAADNALLLRFAEVDGKIIRLISCMKKRLGEYESELRELIISNKKAFRSVTNWKDSVAY